MQSYSCVAGETCTGQAVQTSLPCNCGGSTCTVNGPFIPLIPVVVPIGAPLPPYVPPPLVPPVDGPQASNPTTSTASSSSSSQTSTNSTSTITSTTTSSNQTSTTITSTSTTAPACNLTSFSIPSDFDQTISAWLAQFPFTLDTTSSTTSSMTSSASPSEFTLTASTTLSKGTYIIHPGDRTSISDTLTVTKTDGFVVAPKTPTSTISTVTLTGSTRITKGTYVVLPNGKTAEAATYTVSDGHGVVILPTQSTSYLASITSASSFTPASSLIFSLDTDSASFNSWLSSDHARQSASIASVSSASAASAASASASAAMSACSHYAVPLNPTGLPPCWEAPQGQKANNYLRLANTEAIAKDKGAETWPNIDYQPFNVHYADDPDATLIDRFCGELVDKAITVTYDGDITGACQKYGKGECKLSTAHGGCTLWEHSAPALGDATVIFSVQYMTPGYDCDANDYTHPKDFAKLGKKECVKMLKERLIDKCTIKNPPAGDFTSYPTVGGTLWNGCMMYTIVAVKNPSTW